jgi:D-alanyl-D-alanine carboxypeptidase (penicillin-binding protein 5/6)
MLCLSLLFVVSSAPIYANVDSEIAALTAEFALAIDVEQDTVLYEKNADKKMYPASMTKIVTVIVALQKIENLEEIVIITQNDLDTIFETGASAAYFEVGEEVTYRDLIYGAMLPSGADATRALAHNLSASYSDFIAEMNDLSKKLGLVDTNFVNSTGIHDDNHYTTAKDLAVILRYAINNKDFMEVFSTYFYTTENGSRNWLNTGMFTGSMLGINNDYIIGCKSGYTHEAERCLASLIMVDSRQVITIVGHSNREIRGSANIDTNLIADFVEENYTVFTIHRVGDVINEIPIMFGVDDLYTVSFENDVNAYLPINFESEDLKYTFVYEEIKAPVQKNQVIGAVRIEYQDREIYNQDFHVDRVLERNNLKYINYSISNFIISYKGSILFILVFIILFIIRVKKRKKI